MNRADIRTFMRLLLNEGEPGFWKDEDLNKCIDAACKRVSGIISSTRNEYFTQSSVFSSVVNIRSYSIPSDCRMIRRIEIYDPSDASKIFKLDEIKFPRIEAGGPWPFSQTGQPARYTMVGTHFDLYPLPDEAYPMRIYYDVRQDSLSDDTSIPTIPLDFHDMIAYWGCALAFIINSEPPKEFVDLFDTRKEELISVLLRRGSDDPKVIEGYLENII